MTTVEIAQEFEQRAQMHRGTDAYQFERLSYLAERIRRFGEQGE